jgi:protein O-GlcNAc transferase
MNPPSELAFFAAESEHLADLNRSRDLYRQALEQHPDDAQLWASLGRICCALGQEDEALLCYGRAAQLRPDDPDLLCELGIMRMQRGELAEAVALYQQALHLRPDFVTAQNDLGLALLSQGRAAEARLYFQQVLSLRPDLAAVHNNLGLALLNLGQLQQAVPQFQEAIRLEPDLADAHNNLGLALDIEGKPDDSFACYERAVQVDPDHLGALTNLGTALKDKGRVGEAIACYRKVLTLRPSDAPAHSNLLLAMQYQPSVEPREILAEARRYAQEHADLLAQPHELGSTSAMSGRLRIGYVSPDYREHPVTYFLEPILAAHDHERFEIFCYADVPHPDAVTQRLQGYADSWRSLVGLSDAEAARVIREDEISILIDLAGHTAGNRLLALARKPAPIQVSYLGYLGTTGLATIDYYLTDDHADPTGVTDEHYQERLIRLPECGFCYRPGPTPEISPEPPALRSGHLTFGCLNNPAKLTEEVLFLWSRVMTFVPGSQLFLASGGSQLVEERIRSGLGRLGISIGRLRFAGRSASRHDYLKLYYSIDIALDPFPYNGVTTTCDALWMGVPVISLTGVTNVSRQGVRFLRNVDLAELLASSPGDYVRIAADLARDMPKLTALHGHLRERMSRSPLLDSMRLTRDLEAAYLTMREKGIGVKRSVRDL